MSEVVLSIAGLSFGYADQTVLEDVDLDLRRGQFLGLIGPNGSGKTTLLKVALGLLRPRRGEVRWFGRALDRPGRFGHRVAYVPPVLHAFTAGFPATVAEVAAAGRASRRGLFRRLTADDWDAVDRALGAVGLAGLRERRMAELSGGQQQRAFIARALAAEPEVLMLDEPTAGVDLEGQERFYDLLGRLHAELDLTSVLVSHDLAMITSRVTHLACLNRRLYYHGDVEDFQRGDVDLTAVYGDMHMVAHRHAHHGVAHRHADPGAGERVDGYGAARS